MGGGLSQEVVAGAIPRGMRSVRVPRRGGPRKGPGQETRRLGAGVCAYVSHGGEAQRGQAQRGREWRLSTSRETVEFYEVLN